MARLIFHIDVNSAFLSWEAARRVSLGEDDIRLIPSAIGGDREKRTGVILAKSIPAKKFGVRTGEPVAMALRKCPDLYLARPDFRLYEQSSRAFMDICREYAPVVEKYSIDECFLDMSGTHRLYPDPVVIAPTIKDKIRDTLGFTVNVGIGGCKILAKMASDFEKPDKVHTLYRHEIPQKLWPLPVRDLFTVGASTAEKLEKARMRADGVKAYCVAVSIRSNDFKTRSHQKKLMEATDISSEVYRLCKQLFAELWDGHTPLRLLGVALTDLTTEDTMQMSLFPDEKRERSQKLDQAYDAINKKFGTATIQRGANLQSNLRVGKKYEAQMEQKKKPNE